MQNFKCLPRTHLAKRSNKIGIFDKVAIFIPQAEIAQSILESKCNKARKERLVFEEQCGA